MQDEIDIEEEEIERVVMTCMGLFPITHQVYFT